VTAVLELRSVGKTYPPPTAVTALAKVDLTVGLGETVSITGPSGSGKSTLLNVLGTLERPSTGTVRIGGTDTSTISDRQLSGLRAWRIGFVFQEFHLLEHLTVLDNVATGLIYRGLSVRSRRDAAASALRRVGLGSRVTHRPSRLSGGNGNGPRSRGRSLVNLRSSWPTSRREISTRQRARRSSASSPGSLVHARPSSSSLMTSR